MDLFFYFVCTVVMNTSLHLNTILYIHMQEFVLKYVQNRA
jgi:hypothetical protein